MQNIRTYMLTIFILCSIISCNKNNIEVTNTIYNRWEIIDFISVESMMYAKDNEFNPGIEFHKNGSYSLQLDVNNCLGNFELSGKEGIVLTAAGCTKMCCDSDFSNKVKEMIHQVEGYSIENNKMKLNIPGWGWINLKLNN